MITLTDAQRGALCAADLEMSPMVAVAWSPLDRSKFYCSGDSHEIAGLWLELEILRSLAETGWQARALSELARECGSKC